MCAFKTRNIHCCPKQAIWDGLFTLLLGILRGKGRFQKQVGHPGARMLEVDP
jgi:hypothetical protein